MHPELFKLPFTDLTVKSYGVMVVLGFFFAVIIIKKLCKRVGLDHNELINGAFYSFIVGIIGARIFHVIHYYDSFHSIGEMLAIWRGGLELLGGVLPAILFLILYLKFKKIDVLLSLDIFSAALMIGVAFGRIGCLLNGCCFGQPTDLAFGISFPYDSIPYKAQAYPDYERNRDVIIELPNDYYGYFNSDDQWVAAPEYDKYRYMLKPLSSLSETQRADVSKGGKYSCHAVHPTQLYSSLAAFLNCGILAMFWWKFGAGQIEMRKRKFKAGTTAALMLVLYSVFRFMVENLRGDNPYEVGTMTVSQLISAGMFICGIMLFAGLSQKKASR
ncbi:MAG: prolipoprotein diacylglyceryl transferase [Sedimentisphaeraceae bacterium JB056]